MLLLPESDARPAAPTHGAGSAPATGGPGAVRALDEKRLALKIHVKRYTDRPYVAHARTDSERQLAAASLARETWVYV